MLPIAPDTVLQQRYRIVKMLGESRFGRTYLAVDLGRSEAYCAIEELAPFSQFSSAVTKAKAVFKQEASLLYQLQHSQVPRFWTTFEEQNRLLLVRDYIPGKSYRTLLDERQQLGRTFSEAEVWQFLLELLPAIGYIHNNGTIHRDLSPEHIICRESDRLPCPIDFGIVKEFTNKLQGDLASPRIAVGQIGYAPAEQIHSGQVYPNSDLYTLAVTAIVLLTGKEPSALFQGEQMNWQWLKWTEINDSFAGILRRMLSHQPHDRYQSATEVERDLQAIDEIANSQQFEYEDVADPLSPVQTVAARGRSAFSVASRIQTAITNLDVKSVWEKPIVFIPLGILIAILAGVGSWFGVTQLLHGKPESPVATTPPKQIDFNNPTIPTASPSPMATTGDTIQPEMDRAIEKEGNVDATTPVIYKFTAIAGENLDIQLLPVTAQNPDPLISTGIDPTVAKSSPIPTQPKEGKSTAIKIPVVTPSPVPAKVLMTIISPTGGPIDDNAARVLSWRGQLSTSGDYKIELRPIAGLPGGTFPYKLSVTQLAITPTTIPSTTNPAGFTPPLNIPNPSGSSGLNAIPNIPAPTIPSNDLPTLTPIPLPNQFPGTTPGNKPSESERPARKRKRTATAESSTPAVNRKRVNAAEEAIPPVRKKRSRVNSSEETNSAPRNRRNRQTNTESQPDRNSPTNPDSDANNPNTPPKQEEQIPILIPEPKTDTPPPTKPDPNPTAPSGGTNDPE